MDKNEKKKSKVRLYQMFSNEKIHLQKKKKEKKRGNNDALCLLGRRILF